MRDEPHYTASQYARALGGSLTARRLRQILGRMRAVPRPGPRGQTVHTWPPAALPPSLRLALERKWKELRFLSLDHFMTDLAKPWEPSLPFARLDARCQAKARQRRDTAAPLLSEHPEATLPRLIGLIKASPHAQHESERNIRRWLEAAIDRDRGRLEWHRPELYLDDKLKTANPAAPGKTGELIMPLFNQLRAVPAEPDKQTSLTCWNLICAQLAARLADGQSHPDARRDVLATIEASGVQLAAALGKAIDRKFSAWQADGIDGLRDQRRNNRGRAPLVADVSPEEQAEIWRLVSVMHSAKAALDAFALDPRCSPELRAAIVTRRESSALPLSLRRIPTLPPNVQAHADGPRAYQKHDFMIRRDNTGVFAGETERREIQPGEVWLFDDMSVNHPFWFENDEGADPLAKRHGVGLGRQSLWAMDFATGKWLGFELIGRPRDAYRVADILRFLHRLFLDYGLPRKVIFERGIWTSHAFKARAVERDPTTGEMIIIGGLGELGIDVENVTMAKRKGAIESGFGYVQKIAAGMIQALNVGRKRGERERDCKDFARARAGVIHPKQAGILHIEELGKEMNRVMDFCSSKRKDGRIQKGVPNERWDARMELAPLPAFPPAKARLFLPLSKELTIRAGGIETTHEGVLHRFTQPDLFADLGHGYHLRIAFDPTEPTLGAALYNLEAGASNRHGYHREEFLGIAEHCELSPQFALLGDRNLELRKTYNRSVRACYFSSGTRGCRGSMASEQRDGLGNVLRMERGVNTSSRNEGGSLIDQARALKEEQARAKQEQEDARHEDRLRKLERAEEEMFERMDKGLEQYDPLSGIARAFHKWRERKMSAAAETTNIAE